MKELLSGATTAGSAAKRRSLLDRNFSRHWIIAILPPFCSRFLPLTVKNAAPQQLQVTQATHCVGFDPLLSQGITTR
jgi:hypothetical protein